MTKKQEICLFIDSPLVRADKFMSCLSALYGLVRSVSDEMNARNADSLSQIRVSWSMRVEKSSQKVAFIATTDIPIQEAIFTGIAHLEKGQSRRPKYFNDDTLEFVQKLGRNNDPKGGFPLAISSNGTSQVISLTAASSAEKAMEPDRESYGSLRGLLGQMSIWGGFNAVIHDEATQRNVRCVFKDDKSEQAAEDAFGSRVAAWGKIHYRSDRTPTRLYVETFRPLPKEGELTPISAFRGILKPQ